MCYFPQCTLLSSLITLLTYCFLYYYLIPGYILEVKDGNHSHTLGKVIETSKTGRHRNQVLRASVTSSKVSSGPLCGETELWNYETRELAVDE